MSVWAEIDRKRDEYRDRLAATRARVRDLGGRFVHVNVAGLWCCTYRPTSGDRCRVKLRAADPEALIEALANAPRRPFLKRKPTDASNAEPPTGLRDLSAPARHAK